MRTITVLTLIIIFCGCKNQKSESKHFSCNYFGYAKEINLEEMTNQFGFTSNIEAIEIVNSIISEVGLEPNFEIQENSNVDNAAAVVYNNKRFILYNNEFMETADDISGTQWTSISILAHEIGHHLQGHTLNSTGSRPNLELEADKFSGFVLAKLGASLEDAQKPILTLTSESGSLTHPPRRERLKAIADGFKRGLKGKGISNRNSKKTNSKKTKVQNNQIRAKKAKPSKKVVEKYYESFEVNGLKWMINDIENKALAKETKTTDGQTHYFYDFDTRSKLCPLGWRLPTLDEWSNLNQSMVANGSLLSDLRITYNRDSIPLEGPDGFFLSADFWTSENGFTSFRTPEDYKRFYSEDGSFKNTWIFVLDKSSYTDNLDNWYKQLDEYRRCRCIK